MVFYNHNDRLQLILKKKKVKSVAIIALRVRIPYR